MLRPFAILILVLSGCATVPKMARLDPQRLEGQEVLYKNGAPLITSSGPLFDVFLAPSVGPTGRYEIAPRIRFMVGIRNRSGQRLEVSEDLFRVTGSGEGRTAPGRVVRASEIEDEIVHAAASRRAMNQFATAMRAYNAAAYGGQTTYSGTVQGDNETVRFAAQKRDMDAARAEAREVGRDGAATAGLINEVESAQIDGLGSVIQRHTLEAEESISGFVFIEPPRAKGCTSASAYADEEPGPCKLEIIATLNGEKHRFAVNEIFDTRPGDPPRAR